MEKECITVFSGENARILLRKGYRIVDVKPDKYNLDKEKSIFVFKNEGDFEKDFNALIKKG